MPRTITEVDLLQEYLRGVLDRAAHHATEVDEIALAIAGAVIWKKDGDIKVFEREGKMTNVLWVPIDGNRYALSYNHETGTIDVRQGSTHGNVLASFSNANTTAEVKAFFAKL